MAKPSGVVGEEGEVVVSIPGPAVAVAVAAVSTLAIENEYSIEEDIHSFKCSKLREKHIGIDVYVFF